MLLHRRRALAGFDVPDLSSTVGGAGYQALAVWHIVETPDTLLVALHCLEAFAVRVPQFDASIVRS